MASYLEPVTEARSEPECAVVVSVGPDRDFAQVIHGARPTSLSDIDHEYPTKSFYMCCINEKLLHGAGHAGKLTAVAAALEGH